MDTLRWILLIIGILVLVAIYLLGRRSERDAPGQARDDEEYAPRFDDAVEELHDPEPDVFGLSVGNPVGEEEVDWLDNVRPFRPRADRSPNLVARRDDGPAPRRPRPIAGDDPVVELRPRREPEPSMPSDPGKSTRSQDWFDDARPVSHSMQEASDSPLAPRERSESPLERWVSDAAHRSERPASSSDRTEHDGPGKDDWSDDARTMRRETLHDDDWIDDVRPLHREDVEDGGWLDDVRPVDPEAPKGDDRADDVRPVLRAMREDPEAESGAREPGGSPLDRWVADSAREPEPSAGAEPESADKDVWADDVRPVYREGEADDDWIDDVRPVHREGEADGDWIDDVRPVRRGEASQEPSLHPMEHGADSSEPHFTPPPASLSPDPSTREEPSLFAEPLAEGEPDEDGWIDDVRPISREVTAETEEERRLEGPREIPDRVASALDSAEEEARRRAEAPELPDDVLIMHIVPADPARGYFSGRDLRSAFEAFGLSYGPMDIYHREAGVGLPMFSVVNRIKPGTFNLETMDDTQMPGFSLFMQMPGPDQPMVAFRAMCDCARRLAERLGGRLQDEQGEPMTVQTFNRYEKRVRVFVSGLYRRFGAVGAEPERTPPASPLTSLREQDETQKPLGGARSDASERHSRTAHGHDMPDVPAWARQNPEDEPDRQGADPHSRSLQRARDGSQLTPPQGAQAAGPHSDRAAAQGDSQVSDVPSSQRDGHRRDREQTRGREPPSRHPSREGESQGSSGREHIVTAEPKPQGARPWRRGAPVERDLFDDQDDHDEQASETASARAGAITRKLIERYEDRMRSFVSGFSRGAEDEDEGPDVLMNEGVAPRKVSSPPQAESRPDRSLRAAENPSPEAREPSAPVEEAMQQGGEASDGDPASENLRAGHRETPQRRSLVERATSMRKPRQASEKVHVEPEPGMPEELLIIHIVADPSVGTFGGEHIAEAFEACDLNFGTMQIYHREVGAGNVMFSVVNMLKPGTFDPEHFHEMETPGISLFMQLPGPDQPMVAFRNMRECARRLAENLGGRLEDETHSTMTMQTLSHYEERVRSFIQRQARHAGGRRG